MGGPQLGDLAPGAGVGKYMIGADCTAPIMYLAQG